MFSARGAGILGFSIFGTRPCYALDEHMELDLDGVRAFLEEHQGETIFLFGFTFIIWKHVVRALEERGERLDIPNGILVHGGGWKKLANQAVSKAEYKARLRRTCGITKVLLRHGRADRLHLHGVPPGPPPRQPVVGYRGAAGAGLPPL